MLYARPTGHGFVESSLAALDGATYEPATRDGKPVDEAIAFDMTFELHW